MVTEKGNPVGRYMHNVVTIDISMVDIPLVDMGFFDKWRRF